MLKWSLFRRQAETAHHKSHVSINLHIEAHVDRHVTEYTCLEGNKWRRNEEKMIVSSVGDNTSRGSMMMMMLHSKYNI